MIGVNFAVILLCMSLIGAALFVLVRHLYKFYLALRYPDPRPWLQHNQTAKQPVQETSK